MSHRPRKRFGQNFLHERAYIERMIAAIAPVSGEAIVEIGPGQGALTRPLLEAAGALTVIELDRDLIAGLERLDAGSSRLRIIQGDALRVDPASLGEGPIRIVGNLPYNISTPLLFHLTAGTAPVSDLHLLLQREVVERMAAAPGGGTYGRLSVMIQYRCRVEPLFDVPPGAFTPAPRVTSTFVRLVPHAAPPVDVPDEERLATVVTRAFAARRKTLRNALSGLLETDAIAAAGIDPRTRAETLSLDDFAALARRLG
ncbi:16S rRNA (adenine(1518)-N(6)/adenine(1519)-N(6))-dimethyltransferase RsmA [Arhodomonas aquaeolei]|uniref:16S rRNA (adenine(1518)-N(6)/adenine(1519)-N(6))- dimethyltransferase RsmA n=1 Tax=Arhodomonas aquaeolei TaxID=2369 RepID=UPI000362447A|nr:16S rRNA (adenine(1518)-N(6)/adenine(1519)-N(6))-dimethyltransferase RsmA [Arhodomonas aquaeolei]